MKLISRLKRYVALNTYQTRQAWRQVKEDATELWHCWRFRSRMRTTQSWPCRVLAWMRCPRLPTLRGLGKSGGKKDGQYLSAASGIFDPRNDHLFSKEAALKAFGHVVVDDEKTWGRRSVAEAFLMDAQRDGMSWRSRSDCACEALYLYALAALGNQADKYEHPAADALRAAAEKLGLTAVQIAPAIVYLEHRYDPAMRIDSPPGYARDAAEVLDRSTYDVLISIAKKLGEKNDDTVRANSRID